MLKIHDRAPLTTLILVTFIAFVRDFLEKHYIGLKKDNPKLPILVRECSGIQPKMYARYGKSIAIKALLALCGLA